MRHDALSWLVLIDQHMVGCPMGASGKHMVVFISISLGRQRKLLQTGDDRIEQPRWER